MQNINYPKIKPLHLNHWSVFHPTAYIKHPHVTQGQFCNFILLSFSNFFHSSPLIHLTLQFSLIKHTENSPPNCVKIMAAITAACGGASDHASDFDEFQRKLSLMTSCTMLLKETEKWLRSFQGSVFLHQTHPLILQFHTQR